MIEPVFDEVTESFHAIRDEAKRLEIACINAAKTSTLLHLAFDPGLTADGLGGSIERRLRLVK